MKYDDDGEEDADTEEEVEDDVDDEEDEEDDPWRPLRRKVTWAPDSHFLYFLHHNQWHLASAIFDKGRTVFLVPKNKTLKSVFYFSFHEI